MTAEQLRNYSDTICIICREEMSIGDGSGAGGGDSGGGQIKRLPCDHIFHKSCLRSWFQRQQTCPTCRTSILRYNNPGAGPQQPAAGAQPAGAGVQQQPGQAHQVPNPPHNHQVPNAAGQPQPQQQQQQQQPTPMAANQTAGTSSRVGGSQTAGNVAAGQLPNFMFSQLPPQSNSNLFLPGLTPPSQFCLPPFGKRFFRFL